MDSQLIGETAAVLTSVMWTTCSILFSSAGKRIGAISVNTFRITAAVGLLFAAHIVVLGAVIPVATGGQWFYLGLSGFIGLALGDVGYIGALVLIGPRRGVLLMSTAPIFTAIFAYAVLGESLGTWAIIGVAITIFGVMLAVLEEEDEANAMIYTKRKLTIGYSLAVLGSIGQGVGVVLSKYGMEDATGAEWLNPLSATLIRVIVGCLAMWIGVVSFGKLGELRAGAKDTGAMGRTMAGAVTGPFLGVWMSIIAITYTLAGIAQTLMSLMPIMVIPVVWVVYKQRTSWRGIAGAAIAISGVAILFLMPSV